MDLVWFSFEIASVYFFDARMQIMSPKDVTSNPAICQLSYKRICAGGKCVLLFISVKHGWKSERGAPTVDP